MNLAEPLPPLTSRERSIFWTIAALCAVSRFAARARSLWDWDEVLFCLGMRSFDITLHHPHPPGFPVYIALGRIVRPVVGDDFRSLQAINLVSAMFLFPAVFMLARELRLRFATCVAAAALFVFFPNVWFYGGTAFSDVPSITLVVFGAALLLRGCRDQRAYWAGALCVALAVGIRPQNALVGMFPFLLASRHRRPRDIAVAVLIGVIVVGTAFGGAIAATGSFDAYRSTVRAHGDYISRVDSFHNPVRPPLWRLVALFFAKQYSSPALSIVVTLFVAISIIGAIRSRDRRLIFNALVFGPVAVAAWLFLDRYSVTRFSIGYLPMFAIFAADGIDRVARGRPRVEAAIAIVIIGAFIAYTLPVLAPVRRDIAPSVAAVEAAKSHFNAATDDLYVAFDMVPFVDYLMPDVPYIKVLDERAMLLSSSGKTPHLIAEIIPTTPAGFVFRRARPRLWNISRRHYYGVAYATVTRFPQFVSGWYPAERSRDQEWRSVAAKSVTILPDSKGDSLLRLGFTADRPARVTVAMNGRVIDAFDAQGEVQRDWHVQPAAIGAPNTLEITTDRDRAIRVRFLSWATY